ncbi:hypothetical protein K4H00_25050, partial [Mycobacterium tuberculosis]|nr:hypothetical protein [Mycobacterium tuberculosis]
MKPVLKKRSAAREAGKRLAWRGAKIQRDGKHVNLHTKCELYHICCFIRQSEGRVLMKKNARFTRLMATTRNKK